MKKLTKKYIFERKLDGKPIIIYVEESHGRWADKKDLAILREYGILIEHHSDEWPEKATITTHEIFTYLIPRKLNDNPISRLPKGQIMPGVSDINVTD